MNFFHLYIYNWTNEPLQELRLHFLQDTTIILGALICDENQAAATVENAQAIYIRFRLHLLK